jgi:hypothetical protein
LFTASFIAKCTLSEIIFINIQAYINKIIGEDLETTPHMPVDFKTWRIMICIEFPDLCEQAIRVPSSSKYDFHINIYATVKIPDWGLYLISHLKCVMFEI